MTEQEIFDKAVAHLRTQVGQATDIHDDTCVYRVDSDKESPKRCAVGALIPNSAYLPEMEGTDVPTLIQRLEEDHPEVLEQLPWLNRDTEPLLSALQRVHDKCDHWGNPEDRHRDTRECHFNMAGEAALANIIEELDLGDTVKYVPPA